MANWSSGVAMRELGLGHGVVLPSDPGGRPVHLHGEQTLEALTRIIGKETTPEDLGCCSSSSTKKMSNTTS